MMQEQREHGGILFAGAAEAVFGHCVSDVVCFRLCSGGLRFARLCVCVCQCSPVFIFMHHTDTA